MNHLAHALLAGDDPALRLGAMLGDFVHGQPDPALGEAVVAGIRLHRAIDVFTDAHPQVVAARALFEPPFRRYAGIMLDVWFDHCLARDFSRWAGQPLAPYSEQLRALLRYRQDLLPPALQRFLAYMETHDLPAGYAAPAQIGRSLQGIGQRLRRANPLDQALPQLLARASPLQGHFEALFPQLQAFAQDWRAAQGLP